MEVATNPFGGSSRNSGNKRYELFDDPDFTERTVDSTERNGSDDVADEMVSLKDANHLHSGNVDVPVQARLADLESQLHSYQAEMMEMQKSNKELMQSKRNLEKMMSERAVSVVSEDELKESLLRQISTTILEKKQEEPHEQVLSADAYSFLFCSPVCSSTYWTGMIIVWMQFGVFALFLIDLLSTQTVPPNVESPVRICQFIAISITFIAQSDIRTSLRSLIYREGVQEAEDNFHTQGFTMTKFLIANILMLLQGCLGVVVAIALIVLSDNVMDLLLNFTAITFVSELDELVFLMASLGYIGRSAENLAKKITGTTYKERVVKGWTKYFHIYAFMVLVAIGYAGLTFITVRQTNNYGLAKVVKVQFDDSLDPNLGLYSGCFKIQAQPGIAARVTYTQFQQGRAHGRFEYCVQDDVRTWIFVPTDVEKPCENPYLRSAEKRPTSFDVLDTKSDQWLLATGNPISGYQMVEIDDEHVDVECGEEFENGGENLCPILTMDSTLVGFSDNRDWSRNFDTLVDSQGQVVNHYQHPVYVGEYPDEVDGLELLFFTGRRWVLTAAKFLFPEGSSSDPSNKQEVISLFQSSSDLKLLELPVGTFKFMSEAVSLATDRGTPLGLRWYFTRYKDDGSATFPISDVSRPSDAIFSCGKCNAIGNPCRFEGVCRDDGTCDCKHGATGKLCDIKPLHNGVCNQYFNRGADDFDGGDCCVASCDAVTCGIGAMIEAFGQELQLAGNGFPNCKDPDMVPLTIVLNSTINEEWGEGADLLQDGSFTLYTIQVQCGDDVPLQIVIDPWIQGLMSETLFLADQTRSCKMSFLGIQTDSELNITYQLLDGSLSGDGPIATMGNPVNVSFDATFDLPGLYSRCLKETLDDVIQHVDLYSGSYQDDSIAWLDNEIRPNAEHCGEKEWLTQRYALAATSFAEMTPEPWINSNDHCLWSRVTCKASRPVVLSYEGSSNGALTGFLATEIGLLTHLERIDVYYNNFDGTLPTELGALTALTALGVPFNNFKGTIPTQLGSLTALQDLVISQNQLTGIIPTELGNLKSLTYFGIQTNRLGGSLPTELVQMASCTRFDASENRIGGTIPSEFGKMTNLTYLALLHNQINGKLPTELGSLEDLSIFLMGSNVLTGTIPTEYGKLTNLSILWLATNQLSGPIPSTIGSSMQSLTWLFLNWNKLTGKIPSTLAFLPPTLEKVRLEHNRLTGEIPSGVIGGWTNLDELRLSDNLFQGNLPTEFGLLTKLTTLQASNNNFGGSIPTGIFDLPLAVLHLDSNRLTGQLVPEVGRLTDLTVLRLHNNTFRGALPSEIGLLTNLIYLDLGRNNFTSTLPSEIGLLTNLKYLRVNENQFTGPIPSQINELVNLVDLDMTGNLFDETGVQDVMSTLGLAFTCNETAVEVKLETDNNPGDVFWELSADDGTVVASGFPEAAVQYFEQTIRICVPSIACNFVFGDQHNNGGTLATITRLGNIYAVGGSEESFPGGSYENMLSVNICENDGRRI